MKADYAQMNDIYTGLNDIVDDMIDQINKAKNIVSKMDSNEHWNGDGYKAYNEKFKNMSQNFGAYCNDLYNLNNVIKQTINKLQDVDKKLMGDF